MSRGDDIAPAGSEGDDGGWGAAQRDARFVRKLIRAQLALAREGR
jgi:hypothetical protein